jgi:hypothetical protein
MTLELFPPLDHRVRRRILRCLHRGDTARTAGELSVDLNLALVDVWYHIRVLLKYDKVKQLPADARQANAPIESLVADDSEVVALLLSTEADDERR